MAINPVLDKNKSLRFTITYRRRTVQAFFLGAVTGFLWLLPVTGQPSVNAFENDATPLRFLRLLAPLLIWLMLTRSRLEETLVAFLNKIPRGILPLQFLRIAFAGLVLGLIPFLIGLSTGSVPFFVSVAAPLVLSAIVLVGITLIEERDFRDWTLGIGFMALSFLLIGIARNGFAQTGYFGRPRALMGFIHPVHTGSAVIGALIFLALFGQAWLRERSQWTRRLLTLLYLIVGFGLLYISQSRNILFAVIIGVLGAWLARRYGFRTRFVFVAAILGIPLLLYAFVLLAERGNPIWDYVNALSSARLITYQAVLRSLIDQGGVGFTANASRLEALSTYAGFAAADSVFLSFLVNFGLVGIGSFLALIVALGWRLSLSRLHAVPFGALCAMIVLFTMDAQGATTSNLIQFILFAYTVRAAALPLPKEPLKKDAD